MLELPHGEAVRPGVKSDTQAPRDGEARGAERWIEIAPPDGSPLLVLTDRSANEPGAGDRDELPDSPVRFVCDDMERTHRELSARGVRFAIPPTQMSFGWWAVFEDDDGIRYGLGQSG